MSEVVVDKLEFEGIELVCHLSESVKKLVLYDTKADRDVKKLSDTIDTVVSFHAKLQDGTMSILEANDEVYESLACTAFDPERNAHYLLYKDEMGRAMIGVWRTESKEIAKEPYYLRNLVVEGNQITFMGSPNSIAKAKDVRLMLWCQEKHLSMEVAIPVEDFATGHFKLDIEGAKDALAEDCLRWDVMLRVKTVDGQYKFQRMEWEDNSRRMRRKNKFEFLFAQKEDLKKDRFQRCFEGIEVDDTMLVCPNYSVEGILSLQGVPSRRYYMQCFSEEVVEYSLNPSELSVKVRCMNRGFAIGNLCIQSHSAKESERYNLKLVNKIKDYDGGATYEYSISLSQVPWQVGTYEVIQEEEKDEVVYDIAPKVFDSALIKRLRSKDKSNYVHASNYILQAQITESQDIILTFK